MTVNLGFSGRRRYFSFKLLLSYPHEAEWTPIENHYFSDTLVAPGIEPETFGFFSKVLWPLDHRGGPLISIAGLNQFDLVFISRMTLYLNK
jgi:hypothetical protein